MCAGSRCALPSGPSAAFSAKESACGNRAGDPTIGNDARDYDGRNDSYWVEKSRRRPPRRAAPMSARAGRRTESRPNGLLYRGTGNLRSGGSSGSGANAPALSSATPSDGWWLDPTLPAEPGWSWSSRRGCEPPETDMGDVGVDDVRVHRRPACVISPRCAGTAAMASRRGDLMGIAPLIVLTRTRRQPIRARRGSACSSQHEDLQVDAIAGRRSRVACSNRRRPRRYVDPIGRQLGSEPDTIAVTPVPRRRPWKTSASSSDVKLGPDDMDAILDAHRATGQQVTGTDTLAALQADQDYSAERGWLVMDGLIWIHSTTTAPPPKNGDMVLTRASSPDAFMRWVGCPPVTLPFNVTGELEPLPLHWNDAAC